MTFITTKRIRDVFNTFYQCSQNWCNFQSAPLFRYTVYCHSNFEEKHIKFWPEIHLPKNYAFLFLVLDRSLLKMSKIGIMIHVKALFHRLVCRNFQWMSQLLNQRNFLEKEKVLSEVKAEVEMEKIYAPNNFRPLQVIIKNLSVV